jgi:hypothetical protein
MKVRFKDLTEDEIAYICNGCGGKGGIFNPPDFLFTASCYHHDFNYWLGGSEEDRKRADTGFLNAMLLDARRVSGLRMWFHLFLAYLYYYGVRFFGGKFFHYSAEQKTRKDLDEEMEKLRHRG